MFCFADGLKGCRNSPAYIPLDFQHTGSGSRAGLYFIERLEFLCPATHTRCYAWAFLSNHAHFLFRTGTAPLSRLMRRLLTGYVIGFNHRHRRRGQLFQNRFKHEVFSVFGLQGNWEYLIQPWLRN